MAPTGKKRARAATQELKNYKFPYSPDSPRKAEPVEALPSLTITAASPQNSPTHPASGGRMWATPCPESAGGRAVPRLCSSSSGETFSIADTPTPGHTPGQEQLVPRAGVPEEGLQQQDSLRADSSVGAPNRDDDGKVTAVPVAASYRRPEVTVTVTVPEADIKRVESDDTWANDATAFSGPRAFEETTSALSQDPNTSFNGTGVLRAARTGGQKDCNHTAAAYVSCAVESAFPTVKNAHVQQQQHAYYHDDAGSDESDWSPMSPVSAGDVYLECNSPPPSEPGPPVVARMPSVFVELPETGLAGKVRSDSMRASWRQAPRSDSRRRSSGKAERRRSSRKDTAPSSPRATGLRTQSRRRRFKPDPSSSPAEPCSPRSERELQREGSQHSDTPSTASVTPSVLSGKGMSEVDIMEFAKGGGRDGWAEAGATGGEADVLRNLLIQYDVKICGVEPLLPLHGYEIVFIADDSGSMSRSSVPKGVRLAKGQQRTTRWCELKRTVAMVSEFACCLDEDGIDLYFLNRPPVRNIKDISDKRVTAAFEKSPHGTTPLTAALRRVMKDHQDSEKPVLVLVATDGVPDGGVGPFTDLLHEATAQNFRFQILGFAEGEQEMAWLNSLDNTVDGLDVTSQYHVEAAEILATGKVKTFSRSDWIMKALLGAVNEHFDALDEPEEEEAVDAPAKCLGSKGGGCCTLM